MAAEAELIDIVLAERWPSWRVRGALEGTSRMAGGSSTLQDVWLAGPPWRAGSRRPTTGSSLASAAMGLIFARPAPTVLAAPRLVRQRAKGDAQVEYDLRPLLGMSGSLTLGRRRR